MTQLEYENLQRGDAVYFARIMPKFGYYEIHDVVMVSKYDDYCTVCEATKSKQTFLLNKKSMYEQLYIDREEALTFLKEQKKINKDVKVYTKTNDEKEE